MKHPRQPEIIEAIKAERKYKDIQESFGCSELMIRYWKRKLKMPMREFDTSAETDKKISKLLEEGKTQMEIIKEVKTHSQRVCKVRNGKVKSSGDFGGWF